MTKSWAGAGRGAGRDPACQDFAVRHSEDSRKGQTAQDFLQMTRQTPTFLSHLKLSLLLLSPATLRGSPIDLSKQAWKALLQCSHSSFDADVKRFFSHFEQAKDTVLNNCFRSKCIHLKPGENISGNKSNRDKRWRTSSIRTCLLLLSEVKKRSELALIEEIMQHSIPLPINTATHESQALFIYLHNAACIHQETLPAASAAFTKESILRLPAFLIGCPRSWLWAHAAPTEMHRSLCAHSTPAGNTSNEFCSLHFLYHLRHLLDDSITHTVHIPLSGCKLNPSHPTKQGFSWPLLAEGDWISHQYVFSTPREDSTFIKTKWNAQPYKLQGNFSSEVNAVLPAHFSAHSSGVSAGPHSQPITQNLSPQLQQQLLGPLAETQLTAICQSCSRHCLEPRQWKSTLCGPLSFSLPIYPRFNFPSLCVAHIRSIKKMNWL